MSHTRPLPLSLAFATVLVVVGFPFTRVIGPTAGSNATMLQFASYTSNRFPVTNRCWPTNTGEGNVCLWAKDALAAFSLTIDDNLASDHPTWIALGEKYKLRFSWMVIEARVGTPNVTVNGEWSNFTRLVSLGHDVQSHSYDHDNMATGLDLNFEYGWPVQGIGTNVAGSRVLTLAYPGGTFSNDSTVADQYYIGARGTTGTINEVRKLQYRNTCSISAIFNLTNTANDWSYFPNLFNPAKVYYRGWYAVHYHGMGAGSNAVDEGLAYVVSNSNDLWAGLYRQVIQYAQERETASLVMDSVASNEIRFTLRDGMDDALFDFPLAVKVRVDPSWTNLEAIQSSSNIPVRCLTNGGDLFALVEAVPDRGQVRLFPQALVAASNTNGATNTNAATNTATNSNSSGLGVPSSPTQLALSELKAAQWRIQWGGPTTNAIGGYVLERNLGGAGWLIWARVGSNVLSTNDSALPLGSVCAYRIAATNEAGRSDYLQSADFIPARRLAVSGAGLSLSPENLSIQVAGLVQEKNFDEPIDWALSLRRPGSSSGLTLSNLGGSGLQGCGSWTNRWVVPGAFDAFGRYDVQVRARVDGSFVGNEISFSNQDLSALLPARSDLAQAVALNQPWRGVGEGIVFAMLAEGTTAQVYGISGRSVAEIKPSSGSLSGRLVWLPPSGTPPGIYLVVLKSPGGSQRVMKIVVKP